MLNFSSVESNLHYKNNGAECRELCHMTNLNYSMNQLMENSKICFSSILVKSGGVSLHH